MLLCLTQFEPKCDLGTFSTRVFNRTIKKYSDFMYGQQKSVKNICNECHSHTTRVQLKLCLREVTQFVAVILHCRSYVATIGFNTRYQTAFTFYSCELIATTSSSVNRMFFLGAAAQPTVRKSYRTQVLMSPTLSTILWHYGPTVQLGPLYSWAHGTVGPIVQLDATKHHYDIVYRVAR